jgi:hypothetical protein
MACVHSLFVLVHVVSPFHRLVSSRLEEELPDVVGSRRQSAPLGCRHDGVMRVCLAVFNLADPECDRSVGEGGVNLKNASGVERRCSSGFWSRCWVAQGKSGLKQWRRIEVLEVD